MAAGPTDIFTSRIVSIRLPQSLEHQLSAIAERDANTVSATVRRLLTLGIRTETRSTEAPQ